MKLPGWLNLNTMAAAIIVGLCLYVGVLKYQLMSCKLDAKDNQSTLDRISDGRNEQREVTTRTIERVRVEYKEAEEQAERIEQAPLPGNCETPPEIMGAGL